MIHKHYYKQLAEKMTPCRKVLLWTFPILLIIALSLSALPLFIQVILQAAFIEKNASTLQTGFLAIMILLIIRSLTDYGSQHLARKAGDCLCAQLNADLFGTLLNLPIDRYQKLDKDQATTVALTRINEISLSTIQMLTVLVRDTLMIIGLIACMAWLDRDFALFTALLIPFAVIMLQVIQGQYSAKIRANAPLFTSLVNHLLRSIIHFRHIRLYGGQQQEYRLLKKISRSLQRDNAHQSNYSAFIETICLLILSMIFVAISYLMLQQGVRNQFSIDQLGAFAAATLLMIAPISRLATIPRLSQKIQKDLEQLFLLLDQRAVYSHNSQTFLETQGNLFLEAVSFCGPILEKTAQYKLDLHIKSGEIVAFVCQCKQERSLLIDLLLGFHQPSMGKLRLNGNPFDAMEHADLLAHFAMVSDEPVILNKTVAGNIAYGLTECAREASITAAAQLARASEFVREMPNGLQTQVDENGANMTNQQWQIIEIARAQLKNAPILILDNLWLQPNQPFLNEALKNLIQNRTVIVVIQSLPATEDLIDRIFLLNNGVVTEQ
ncbi:ABC transporter transmembrane domain-containing protein [Nitrosomonas sp.]|uniref:ABC transporter transmembrane domain-containing protein n=1 Tax=Nitrosomonas sp. TaxID=42353 RepID=UPI0028507684|nr:ABC transporter transmembrane domain-containing protein [Nitrosomonas sp.]MDR4514418.1 ABC transporter ATP-binding protein/permease [Nitrosomonas sp.]